MKKLIIGVSLGLVSAVSMAATVCTGTAGDGTQITEEFGGGVAGAAFVKTSFTPKCSANTQVDFVQNASAAAAGGVSTKGNQVFAGHTNGGSAEKVADYSGTTPEAALAAAVTQAAAKLTEAGGGS